MITKSKGINMFTLIIESLKQLFNHSKHPFVMHRKQFLRKKKNQFMISMQWKTSSINCYETKRQLMQKHVRLQHSKESIIYNNSYIFSLLFPLLSHKHPNKNKRNIRFLFALWEALKLILPEHISVSLDRGPHIHMLFVVSIKLSQSHFVISVSRDVVILIAVVTMWINRYILFTIKSVNNSIGLGTFWYPFVADVFMVMDRYRLCRGLAPDGTPLLSSNSVFLLPDTFLWDEEGELVKFNKPPAIQRNPELEKISSIKTT